MALSDTLTFHAATDVGKKRSHNEDNYLVDRDLGLFVVADGMGGHAAGEVASAIAVRSIHDVIRHDRGLIQDRAINGPQSEVSVRQIMGVLELAVQSASQRIHAEAQKDSKKRGMGTTVSLLLLIDSFAYVAHVGDSRIYLLRDGYLHRVTEDHTVANELLRLGMVTPEQLDRIPRKNAITRAVGVYQHAEIDTLTLEVLPNDQFLLCSDGLYGYFDETGEDLSKYLAAEDGEEVVKRLVSFANDKGGKDNITGLLVRLGSGDNNDSVRARRVAMKREMLAGLPLFSRLSERELLHVMQVADVYQYEANEPVVRAGEHGDQMFVALQGRLKVCSGQTTLNELGPGDHFGEMALIRNVPRSADVVAMETSEVVSIRRSDFFEIIRSEPHIAVKLLWQFLGVLANRLEKTSLDLSKAHEQLGVTAPTQAWIDEEPSLDPFTAKPVAEALSSMGIRLDDLPGGKNHNKEIKRFPPKPDEAVEQRADAPSFERAPEMAQRIADPSTFDSGSGSDFGPDAAKHLERVAKRAEGDGDFDARVTRPRTKLGAKKTMKMPREAATLPDPAALRAQSAAFDGKSTLPSQPSAPSQKAPSSKSVPSRPRVETLKSASGALLGTGSRRRPSVPAPPASTEVQHLPPTSKDTKSTRPDGQLRAAREVALSSRDPATGEPASHASSAEPDDDDESTRDQAAENEQGDAKAAASPLDRKTTLQIGGASSPEDESFRPTKVTIPLEPPDALKSELDQLRKEFKERLRKSREARARTDGQRGGRKDSD